MRFYQALGLLLLTSNATSFVPYSRSGSKASTTKSFQPDGTTTTSSSSSSSLNLSPKEVGDTINNSFNKIVGGTASSSSSLNLSPKVIGDTINDSLNKLVGGLDNVNSEIGKTYQTGLQSVLAQIKALLSEEQGIQGQITTFASQISQSVDSWLLEQNPEVEQVYKSLLNQLSESALFAENSTPLTVAITGFVTYSIVSTVLSFGEEPRPSKPYPLQRYDPIAAQAYFDGKIAEAVTRALDISLISLSFGLSLLKDYVR